MSDGERSRLEEALSRIEALVSALDRVADGSAREAAREVLQLVLDLHGLALARILAIAASAEDGCALVARLAQDEQVRAALLLHGLHPEPIEERVQRAVERLQPQLGAVGFRVRVVAVGAAMVRLRVTGAHGPEGSRAMGLRQQIEAAIVDEAPDLDEIAIEGLEDAGVGRAELAAG
ncbi:MAG: NifU family protein [Acetobacteraceae bacterium]|nr:NifU family protein [Acetobacteraceae bacterium]